MMSARGSRSVLQTDLYQLTMAAAYFERGHNPMATFDLFVRKLPKGRSYLVVAGLEEALEALEQLRFAPEEIEYLRACEPFASSSLSEGFFEMLARLRFSGEVWAMAEGTVAFPAEPLMRVTAPLIEVQLFETYLLSVLNFSTMVASKAARIVDAAQGRGLLEFGTRRAHGPGAGLIAARSAYIAGFAGTSNVEAGLRFGIPIAGTCAHSFIMSYDDEATAFAAYQKTFPNYTTLLVDTYDTPEGARIAAAMKPPPQGIRLDSGDLAALAFETRKILDDAGCHDTKIVASSDLNEDKIAQFVEQGAPIDVFGVGTELATVRDAPAISGVYKLVEQEAPDGSLRYVAKNSPGKPSYPGKKQVYREFGADGVATGDRIALADEPGPEGATPLLEQVMVEGRRTLPAPSLDAIRAHCRRSLGQMPAELRKLSTDMTYPVRFSQKLEEARLQTLAAMESKG